MSEMTREEAIKRIEKMVEGDDELGCLFIRKDIEALNMAISALSAEGEEKCKDCITNYQRLKKEWHKLVKLTYPIFEEYSKLKKQQSGSAEGEYIKKEDALNKVEELKKIHFDRVVVLNKVSDGLNGLPTYSFPDREKGEWKKIWRDDCECSEYVCSKCDCGEDYVTDFCPNCGADMRGDKAND